jgi:hypothetical protein
MQKKRKLFEDAKLSLTREMVRFEKEKGRDFMQAIKTYANLQVQYSQECVELAQSTMKALQSLK